MLFIFIEKKLFCGAAIFEFFCLKYCKIISKLNIKKKKKYDINIKKKKKLFVYVR